MRQLPTNINFSIPYEVMTDTRLNLASRVLYAEVLAMSYRLGFCYAANSHFSEVLGISVATISRSLVQLQQYNYIKVSAPMGKSRKIRLSTPLAQVNQTAEVTDQLNLYEEDKRKTTKQPPQNAIQPPHFDDQPPHIAQQPPQNDENSRLQYSKGSIGTKRLLEDQKKADDKSSLETEKVKKAKWDFEALVRSKDMNR